MSPSKQTCTVCGIFGHNKKDHNPPKTEKKCFGCKEVLPIDMFYCQKVNGVKNPQYSSYCKPCDVINHRQRAESSLETKVKRLFNSITARCKRDEIEFDITVQDILNQIEIQHNKCFYTGEELSFKNGKHCLSVDKFDPEKGYIKSNIVITSWEINEMKKNLDYEYFINLCKKISEYGNNP